MFEDELKMTSFEFSVLELNSSTDIFEVKKYEGWCGNTVKVKKITTSSLQRFVIVLVFCQKGARKKAHE